jgi:hypothetical protein
MPRMAGKKGKPDLDTARRLKILRYYAGCEDSQTRFAAMTGFTTKHWNNLERGHPLPRDAAIQLVRRFPGLSLDWLHLGVWDHLPGRMRLELEEAERRMMSAPPERARR